MDASYRKRSEHLECGRAHVETGIDVAAHALINNLDSDTFTLVRDLDFMSADGIVVRVYAIVTWNSIPHSKGNGSHQLGLVVGSTACSKTWSVECAVSTSLSASHEIAERCSTSATGW